MTEKREEDEENRETKKRGKEKKVRSSISISFFPSPFST
jgi:hypothetical protein